MTARRRKPRTRPVIDVVAGVPVVRNVDANPKRTKREEAIVDVLTALVFLPILLLVTSPLWWLAVHVLRWAIR